MRKLLGFAEHAFTVISLLLYSGGPLTVILSNGANEGDLETGVAEIDSSLILVFFFINYLVTCCLLVLRWKKFLSVLKKDKLILVLIGLAAISMLWSYMPGKTISRSIAIFGTTLFGIYLASRYTMKQQLELLGWMFGIAVLMSFIFAIGLPKLGVMGGIHEGKWRGIYNHKSVLGKVMVPSIIVFILLAVDARKNLLIYWIGSLLSLILLLRSTATSSLLNTIALLAAALTFPVFRWRYNWMIPGIIFITTLGSSLYVLLILNIEILLGTLGKDTTLTGRADMWPFIFEMIFKNLWLGYGYGAFWSGPDTPSYYIWQATGWTPPNSHNGVLDLWLHLGLLGLAIFTFEFLLQTLPKAVLWVRLSNTAVGLWPLLYMFYLVLANLSESTLMIQNDIFWVIYVALAFSVRTPPENTHDYKKIGGFLCWN
jgi:exopolysaccharide production protein ExoQ